MTETKTETLVDVLKELSSLAPERFIPIPSKQNIRVTYGGSSRPVYLPSITASQHAHVLYACMEECEARGWAMRLDSNIKFEDDSPGWVAEIFGWYEGSTVVYDFAAPSACLALATALRDAIKAEEL